MARDDAPSEPVPLRAVPAAGVRGLRGRRIVLGVPGQGWRYDHRADDPVTSDGQTFVPALLEADYYRSELDNIEIFAPLVPIDQVWVEQPYAPQGRRPEPPASTDLLSRLITLDAPPERRPLPARDAVPLTGRRVVLTVGAKERRDLRAVTEPYLSQAGDICTRICDEADWYRWAFTGRPPVTTETPVYPLWAE